MFLFKILIKFGCCFEIISEVLKYICEICVYIFYCLYCFYVLLRKIGFDRLKKSF